MHRVRQSLPYLREQNWEAVTLAVDPAYVDSYLDERLLQTLPADAHVHRVPALDYRWTRKLGLGSVALRSMWHLWQAGNERLQEGDIDLVYFSTTAFPVLVLGRLWKRQFGVPYVIDMQDPWRSDHYLDVPPDERPPKFWFSYRLDKYLEPIAMREVDGIISVSQGYCDTLQERYPNISPEMCRVIPFGGAEADFEALGRMDLANPIFESKPGVTNVVYVGRGGHDMARAAEGIFGALADGLHTHPELFEPVRMYFVGTDYAAEGEGKQTLKPIADRLGVGDRVTEQPARVDYFTALHLLREADMVVLPGSDDPAYTASKLYPYILARRPMLAVFNAASSVVDVLDATEAGEPITFSEKTTSQDLRDRLRSAWADMLTRLPYEPETRWEAFEPYTAREMTRRQVLFFEEVLRRSGRALTPHTAS